MGYFKDKLGEIPSEFIEPYLQSFLVMQIEAVGCGLTQPEEARNYLRGVQYFISSFAGIHARYAVSNEYDRFINLDDDKMIEICKQTIT